MGIIDELKRRNVVRMAILYVVAAWLVLQVADVLFDAMELPAQWTRLVLAILLLGFPVVLIFSWVYEMTPDGLKRESEVDRSQSITGETGRKLNILTAVLAVLAILAVGADRLVPESTDVQPAANVQTAGEVSEFSIAVIPFANRSAQEDDVYFVDGIHDDILTQLARIGSLTVTSRTSVEQFRNTSLSIPEIASTLGVRNILEGGIQRAGDRVRINMQLINAENDDHLWAETYERELTASNIFEVQADIAKAVTEALHATLQSDEEAALDERPTNSIEAYDLYLLGRHHWNQRTEESIQLAKGYFERAIEEDPEYVLALSGLADSYSFLVDYGNMGGDVAYPLAEEAIGTAMGLDDSIAEVWASLGLLRWVQLRFDEAESALLRATQLDEKSYTAWLWYGNVLNNTNRHAEALAAFEKAYSLEPMARPVVGNLGNAYRKRGNLVQMRQLAERLLQLDPERAGSTRAEIADSFLHEGEIAKAISTYREILASDPNNVRAMRWLGHAYLILGDRTEARQWLQRADSAAPFAGSMYPAFEIDRDFDGAVAYFEDILARVGTRRSVLAIRTLFRARYMDGDIAGAAEYLKEQLVLLNGQIDIDPSDINQLDELLIAEFLIEHGNANGLDGSRGQVMLDEIYAGLTDLNQQGFEHPMTLVSLSVASAIKGDSLASVEFANQAIDKGFRGWYNAFEYPSMVSIRDSFSDAGVVDRVLAANEAEFVKLANMELPAYAGLQQRLPVEMSREEFGDYSGYYSDGNILFRVWVAEDGSFAAVGGQANPVLTILPFEEDAFFTTLNKNWTLRFGRDKNGEVTHILFEINGGMNRLKRANPPPEAIEVPRETLLRYEGTYIWTSVPATAENTSDADQWVAVLSVDDDGVLWVDFDNQPILYLVPFAENKFYMPGFDTTFEFLFDDDSQVATRILNVTDGRLVEFIRQ